MDRRFLLSLSVLGSLIAPVAATGDPAQEAQRSLPETRAEIRTILDRLGSRPEALSSADKAQRQILAVEPRPPSPGFLGGLSPVAPGSAVDVADLARRSPPDPSAGGATSPRLLVFISDSMPRASLRRLARQAMIADATLVLRGVVGGSFLETAAFMRDVLGEKEGVRVRALIDPTLFARYGVRKVPAVVLTPEGACLAGPRACPGAPPPHVHVAGDVTLDYALEYISRTRPAYREPAREVLDRMGGAS